MTPKSGVYSVFTFSHILDIAVVAGKDINALCALTVKGAFNAVCYLCLTAANVF